MPSLTGTEQKMEFFGFPLGYVCCHLLVKLIFKTAMYFSIAVPGSPISCATDGRKWGLQLPDMLSDVLLLSWEQVCWLLGG